MWRYKTKEGTFYIVEKNGWFQVVFDNDSLGSYKTPQQAVDDLAGGHTFWPSSGVDPSELCIPEDLGEWERVRS